MVVWDLVMGDHDAGWHALSIRAVGREVIPTTQNGPSNGETALLLDRNVRHTFIVF